MNEENAVCMCECTHTGISFNHEKEGNPAVCNNMNLEGIMLSEISQTEKHPV